MMTPEERAGHAAEVVKALEDRIEKLERAINHLCEGEMNEAWRIMRGAD